MKKIIILLCLIMINLLLPAQDKLPSFSKIDKADLEMKDCDFDPGAEALVLIDFGDIETNYVENVGWVSESNFRIRIKILKEKAVDRAQIKLKYRHKDKYEEIINVKGNSFNLDAKGAIEVTELERRSIYEKQIDKSYTEISFALPNVRTGSVFEYRYRLLRKSYGYIPEWNFQQRIPVRYSAYNIILPEYFEFTTQAIARQPLERESKTSGEFSKGSWYMMRNIPGLKNEPYSTGRSDYLQRIEFQLSNINAPGYYENVRTTWPKIIEELLNAEEFGGELKKNIRRTGELDAQLHPSQTTKEKLRIIYNYVQQQMLWNENYGFVTYDGIKSAWDKKNGSISEINFILISLLNDAGIKARPLLISTRDNGTINAFYPFLNQFNGVMAYVKDGDDTYIMNAADKYNPFNIIPYDVAFVKALVVDKKEGGLIELASDGVFSNHVFLTCGIEPDGKLAGQATLNSTGYARNLRMESYNKKKEKELFENNEGVTIKIDSISVNNVTDELLPLEQKLGFSGSLQASGEYLFLPFNLFTGLGKNLFIEDERVMDIDFYYPRSYVVTGTFYLPDELTIDALPKNTKLIMPDTSIVLKRIIQKEGNIISFRFNLDIKVFGYGAAAYPYVKEFFKTMYAILDERIVLKKK